jgi:hypothetical protein
MYVVASPIRDGTAEVVADFLLNRVICVYGAFRIMLSDNGKCYQSKVMQEISKAIGANQRFTNPYTPECNGLTERFNKTICEMMSHYIPQSKFVEWDKNVPALVFAHNTSFHPLIRQVPHFLMFNRVARLPIDVSLRLPTASLIADSILSRIPLAFELVVEYLRKAQSKMIARYNENVSDFNFQVNDLVMYYIPIRRKGEPDKLQAKGKGPYRVVELS